MRSFFQLLQDSKKGKNSDFEAWNMQIGNLQDSCEKNFLWEVCLHWSSRQGHNENLKSNGCTMRDIYYLPDGLKAGQIGDFETKIAQIQIFQGSQLKKKNSFEGLFPLLQQLRSWTSLR